jgi:hypothetical protein
MRMLASVQKILEVSEILDKEGKPATSIEAVKVLGWECVAGKGQHKVGDLVVYFEIDSIIPDHLMKAGNLWDEEKGKGRLSKKAGNVLATKRMLGVVSQGLTMSLEAAGLSDKYAKEDKDVTDELGITKYEKYVEEEYVAPGGKKPTFKSKLKRKFFGLFRPMIFWMIHMLPGFEILAGKLEGKSSLFRSFIMNDGKFPNFIAKTDQNRIQNLSRNINDLLKDHYEISEKCEGTSSTYFYNRGDVGMCSRNLRKSKFDTTHFGQIEKKHDLFNKLRAYKQNIAIQGEICGPGIQGNYYNLPEFTLFIFDVYLIDDRRKALHSERCKILSDLGLNLFQAPFLSLRSLEGETIESILEDAITKSVINPKVDAEGKVYKSVTKNISFKAINNDYLLKQK